MHLSNAVHEVAHAVHKIANAVLLMTNTGLPKEICIHSGCDLKSHSE